MPQKAIVDEAEKPRKAIAPKPGDDAERKIAIVKAE